MKMDAPEETLCTDADLFGDAVSPPSSDAESPSESVTSNAEAEDDQCSAEQSADVGDTGGVSSSTEFNNSSNVDTGCQSSVEPVYGPETDEHTGALQNSWLSGGAPETVPMSGDLQLPFNLPQGHLPPYEVRLKQSDLIVDAERELYVQTEDFNEALDILQQHGWVVLCGPPGSGKTALSHALLRYFRKQNFDPLVMTDTHDWVGQVSGERQTVVMMDGTLGEVMVDKRQHSQWRAALSTVIQLVRTGSCLFVLTVYPHVLRELRVLEAGTDSPVLDHTLLVELTGACLLPDIKEDMLKSHIRKLDLDAEVVADVVMAVLNKDTSGVAFPWCCGQVARKWKSDVDSDTDPSAVFTVPAAAHVPLIMRMIQDPEHGESIAAVFLLTMRGFGRFLDKPHIVQPYLNDLGLKAFSDFNLEQHAYTLRGFILAEDGDGFMNRVMYNAVGLALGHSFLMPALLRVCDVRFLVQYVHTTETSTAFSIPIRTSVKDRELFMRRICDDLNQGLVVEISQHPSLESPHFLKRFEVFCRNEKTLKQVLTAIDPSHKLPLVFWSAWSESGTLTEWCLETSRKERTRPSSMLLHMVGVLCVLFGNSMEGSRLKAVLLAIKKDGFFVTPMQIPVPRTEQRLTQVLDVRLQNLLENARSNKLCCLGDSALPIKVVFFGRLQGPRCVIMSLHRYAGLCFLRLYDIFHNRFSLLARANFITGKNEESFLFCSSLDMYISLASLARREVFDRIYGNTDEGLHNEMNAVVRSYKINRTLSFYFSFCLAVYIVLYAFVNGVSIIHCLWKTFSLGIVSLMYFMIFLR